MTQFADFELSIHRRDSSQLYSLEGRLSLPKDDADQRFGLEKPITLAYDPLDFESLIEIPEDYGKALAEKLFADEGAREMWAAVTSAAAAASATLRLRLLIGPSASDLNGVYWEALRDPKNNAAPLFTGENLLFSRYLSASDMRPVNLRPKGDLRALIFVANPADLAEYKLAAVDVAGEISRAQEALAKIPSKPEVIPAKDGERATLNALMEKLRDGYDVVYFAAHGTLANGEPFLWLENEQGKADKISAAQLAVRMRELAQQPRLIVLASCQSAGKGNGQTLQAFGPRLAQAGIPAVLAMQGNISMESVKNFMPVFFEELLRDGQIDRALAVARGVIRDAHDFWMPVLFMRLQNGKIWYVPGQGGDGEEFDQWPIILTAIENEKCTPVLGQDIYEPLMGSWRQLAAALSSKYDFPLSSFYSDVLPQVAQYISSKFDPDTLSINLEGQIRAALQRNFLNELPEPLKTPRANVLQLFSAVGAKLREREKYEQHKILASLPARIYINTNYDDLMFDALKEAKKDPQRIICQWRSEPFDTEFAYNSEEDYQPSVERPLVYHLFGHMSVPESMVLTEDNYYEFLMGFNANKKRTPAVIPPAVLRALADSTLLMLGFNLDDWAFHGLFRMVMVQPGAARRSSNIGVQLEPDDQHNLNPQKARKYLEKYFGDTKTRIYWGKSQDFLRQLAEKLPTV
ncbi:MAG: CHAT domain-containing protein [Anaerolineales bacterium]